MPELPDVELYLHALRTRVEGGAITRVRIVSPFVLRTFDPDIDAIVGKRITSLRRLGKRIVFVLEGDLFLVVHLMIAGRFRWSDKPGEKPPAISLASFDFPNGTLHLTEAGSKKRAGIHVVRGEAALAAHDPGGLEVLEASEPAFIARLRSGNRTAKRTLTDPHVFSGIGNAYSDEILHAAKLSPLALTGKLPDADAKTLFDATRRVLLHWMQKLREDFGDRFPGAGEVTAFRPDFAVHGKFGKPCPVCGTLVQRIRYADNETNYCPRCQTDGKLLSDRSLSRLLKSDWPKSIDELEADTGPK